MSVETLWVNAQPLSSRSLEVIEVVNPSTGEIVAVIPAGCADDSESAVSAAEAAQPEWAARPLIERMALVHQMIDQVALHAEELAQLEALEMGHSYIMAKEWILGVLDSAKRVIDAAPGTLLETLPDGDFVRRDSYGVAVMVVPWNYPLVIALRALPGLLVSGHTVVWKPSEKSPLSARRAIELMKLPPGVVNLVLGDARAGKTLVADPRVGLVIHTGSVASGREIASVSGQLLRPAILELGGKDPVVIDEGIDVDWAAKQVAKGAFINTGQLCTSMERIYVHHSIAESFTKALHEQALLEVVGDGRNKETTIGPLVDERQLKIVTAHVDQAVIAGAKVITGGAPLSGPGFFYPPTILVDCTPDMAIMTEETFGPVAPIMVVDSFEEGVRQASGTEFGLGATVLTLSPENVALGATIPAAVVWVNEWGGGSKFETHEPAKSSGLGAVGDGAAFLRGVTSPRWVHLGE